MLGKKGKYFIERNFNYCFRFIFIILRILSVYASFGVVYAVGIFVSATLLARSFMS